MRIHFGSAAPCVLRLGGVSAGYCGETEKFADVAQERLLAEFLPADGDLLPLSFILEEKFFERPPRCCDVYRYGCGADVYAARFAPREGGLRVLAQGRAGELLVTVLAAGGQAQAAIEGGGRSTLAPLPPAERYEIASCTVNGQEFAAVHCKQKRGMRLLLFNARCECAFDAPVTDYEAGGALTVRHALADTAGHTVTYTLRAEDGTLSETGRKVRARAGFDPNALPARVLPFALFEEIAAGGDPTPYLSPALAPRAHLLKEYLGNFCAVQVPKEIFYLTHGQINAAGLVYPEAENLFEIRFFAADVADGRVTNVSPVG